MSPDNNQWTKKHNMKEKSKKKKKKKIETFSQTCFRAHWFINNDELMALWQITAIIKTEAEAPKKMSGVKNFTFHVQILHPLSPSNFAFVAKILCA